MTSRTILLPNLDTAEPKVSRHELSLFAAGELAPARRAEIESLIAQDAALKATVDAIISEQRADEAAFKMEVPLERFLHDHAARTTSKSPLTAFMSRLRLPALGGLVAAAAAVFILVQGPDEDPNQIKGGRIGFMVKEGDNAKRGTAGEELRAGDRIQFAVRDDSTKSAMVIVGVDGKGEVTVYEAESIDGERSKGDERTRFLPTSVVLDDATGAERFFVVYAEGDVDSVKSRVESAARTLASSGASLVDTAALPLDNSYVQSSVHIVKVAR